MIVDDMRRASKYFRDLTAQAQIVRVPYPVSPFTRDGETFCLWWKKDWDKDTRLPRTAEGHFDSSWWKPVANDFVLFSDHPEAGCLFVMVNPEKRLPAFQSMIERYSAGTLEENTRWTAVLVLFGFANNVPLPVVATGIADVGGHVLAGDRLTLLYSAVFASMFERETHGDAAAPIEAIVQEYLRIWGENKQMHMLDMGQSAASFCTTMALMNCKNVERVETVPPTRLQEARRKKGMPPLVRYHELVVDHKRHGSGTARDSGRLTSEHFCRGHFKTFTAEKPLLGKVVGTFWWNPQIRGDASVGRVDKTYVVKEEKTS